MRSALMCCGPEPAREVRSVHGSSGQACMGFGDRGLRFGFRSPTSLGETDERPCATRLARGIDDGPECCFVAIGALGPDRIDVRAPMAHLRGEPGAVSVVQVPTRSGRTRAGCIASEPARSTGASGTSTASGVFRRPGASVAAGRCGSRGLLTPGLEAERDGIASGQVRDHPHADRIVGLTAFKGIGALFATVLTGEVYRRDFASRRRLSCPVPVGTSFESGGSSRDRSISRA